VTDSDMPQGDDRAADGDGVYRRQQLASVEEALTRVTRLINGRAADKVRMERSGIPFTRPLMSIMRALHEHGPMRILELGALNHMDKGYVSRSWRLLEAADYVRIVDGTGTRSTRIDLTDTGRAAYVRWRQVNAEIVAETFADWGSADLELLCEFLDRSLKSLAHLRA
jgi:DNA-binding MarR family transcriptional regulator